MITTPRRRRGSRRAAIITALVLSVVAGTTLAAPEGGTVVSGTATINTVGNTTTITASNGTIINFNSFNIPAGTNVVFIQPNSTSTVLNRVIGPGPTTINGGLFANGIVYIVNPAGVIFGPSAVVNVGQLYAAAGTITNEDFIKGVNRFLASGGEVVNHGTINAQGVALIGSRVANFGSIVADGNMLVMAAGDQVVLREEGSRVNVSVRTVDGTSAASAGSRAGVQNAGQLRSGGDLVMVSGDMYSLAISQTGKITARNVEIHGGQGGTVEVGGFIDVSDTTRGGVGGTVTITGERVGLFDAVIDASGDAGGGTVRIGGDQLGLGPLPNSYAVYMSPLSRIYADAVRSGNGGTIIMFASDTARIFGDLFARGGMEGGDGGFIETSGRRVLEISKTPVAVARHASGRGGTWLIDPHEITIVAGAGNTNISGANPFESTADGAQLGVDLITGAMTGGVTVVITSNAGPGTGNIIFTVPIDLAATTGTNTLQVNAGAGGNIIFQAGSGVINGSATEALVLQLNTSGGGGIQILANLILGSAGGLVTTGASGITLGANISSGGTITFNAPVDVGGALRTVSGGAITINGVSSGAGGGLSITNTGLLTLNGTITLGSGGFSQTGGGGTALNTNITVNNGNILFDDSIALGAANRTLRTVTGGTITINGTTSAAAGGLTIDNFGLFTSNATINVGTAGFSQVGGGSTNLNASINAGTGFVFFTTPVQLGNSVITVTGGTISFSDVVTAAGAATGLVITNSSVANFDANVTVGGGGFTQNGAGTIILGGNLETTDNGSVDILRALTLFGNITANGTGNAVIGANIALGTAVRTITANDVTLNGTSAGNGGGLVVNNSGTLNTGAATITVNSGGFNQTGAGAVNLQGNITANNAGAIAFSTAPNLGTAVRTLTTVGGGGITLPGTTSGAGGGLSIANSGLLTISGNVDVDSGGFAQTGAGSTALNADINAANGGDISFAQSIALGTANRTLTGNAITLNGTTTGAGGGLTIANAGLFTSNATINVDSAGFNQTGAGLNALNSNIVAVNGGDIAFNTSLNVGTGVRTLDGNAVTLAGVTSGAGGGLIINNAGAFNSGTVAINVDSGGFAQTGAGTNTLGTDITAANGGGISFATSVALGTGVRTLTGTAVTLNGTTTGAGGGLVIANAGLFTSNALINVDSGGFAQTGAGTSALNADITAANNGGISFAQSIALGTAVRTLTTAGTGVVVLNGATTGAGGGLVIANAGLATLGGTITVDSGGFNQTGAGGVGLQGDITANNAGAIAFNSAPNLGTGVRTLTTVGGGTITLPGTSTAAGGGLVINNSGLFTTTGNVAVDSGGFDQTGAGTTLLGGNINAAGGGSISFAQSIDLNGAIRTLATAGAGTITLNGSTGAGASGLSINNAGLLTLNGTINTGTGGFAQVGIGNAQLNGSINSGTGNIIFGSPITLGAGTSTLTGAIVNLVGVTGPGSLTVTNSGNFVLDDAINIGGAFTQNGAGNNQLNANVTAATGISFATQIALGTAVRTLTTTNAGAAISIATTTSGAGGGLIVNNAGLFSTTGNIAVDSGGFSQTGAGTSQLGGNVTASNGGNIAFAQSVEVGTAVRTLTGNDVTLSGSTSGAGGGLVITNAGTFTNNALLNLNSGGFTQNGAGASVMNAGVNAVGGAISFATPLSLGAGVIPFTGTTLAFNTITSGNATSGLQLSNSAASTLNNAVTTGSGGLVLNNSAPLIFGSTVNTDGVVQVNNTGTVRFQNTLTAGGLNQLGTSTASIILENTTANFGSGQAVFRQALQVDGNSTISAGQMVFLAGIIGTANKADDLTLTPTLPATATFTPIIIAGDVGTAGVRLNSLTFTDITDPNPLAPHFATVLFAGAGRLDGAFRVSATPPSITDTFQVFVNNLVMGTFQRMTSFGDLTLNTTTATLGDISVLGTLTLNGTITVRVRPRSDGSDAFGRADPSENTAWVATMINAGGATINANGLDVNNNPFALGPAQQNALFTGGPGSTLPVGFILNPPRQPIDISLFIDPTRAFLVPISLPAGGGSTTPTFITPPALARIADIPDSIAPSASDIEVLRQLNIVPLPVDVPQLVEFLAGRSLYNDFRLAPDEPVTRAEVSRPRLDPTLVRAVADAYRSLSERASDEPGGAPVSRFPEIQSAIGRAWADFEKGRAPAERTGEAFGEYLRATAGGEGDAAENARQAAAAIDEARALMVQVEALGLSPAEVGIVRNRLVNLVFPAPVRAAGRVLLAPPSRPSPSVVLAGERGVQFAGTR
jgi:filamentous hemagglutinin family protein